MESELSQSNKEDFFFLNTKVETMDITPKIIFIVPYRDRDQQLQFFNKHMKYILEDFQETETKIMIIHQNDTRSFNCGAMKNIGFLIVKDMYPNDYKNITLIFNDVDTMPFTKNFIQYQTEKNMVKHFYGFKHTLGGIVSINAENFEKINGFPNFWAWGYEDNMLYDRVVKNKLFINRKQFYDFADKNILHFYDGFLKQVNKTEFERFVNFTSEGIQSIRNLYYTYNNNTNLYDVHTFDTEFKEDIKAIKTHDLHNGTSPFNHIKSNRGATMSMMRL
jgi:hypothetical protein